MRGAYHVLINVRGARLARVRPQRVSLHHRRRSVLRGHVVRVDIQALLPDRKTCLVETILCVACWVLVTFCYVLVTSF